MLGLDRHQLRPDQPLLWLGGIAIVSSAALLLALLLQFGFGLVPCQLCLWERWPYLIVIALAAGGLLMQVPRTALVIILLVLLVAVGLAGYHVGVEQGVLALPSTCAAAGQAQSIEDLRRLLDTAPPSCDQVTASFLGLSLAAWNLVLALLLAGAAIAGLWLGRIRS